MHVAQSVKPSRKSPLLASMLICVAISMTHSNMNDIVKIIGVLMMLSNCDSFWSLFVIDLNKKQVMFMYSNSSVI
jgi:hypothetical protein